MLTRVTNAQFEQVGETEVEHIPTGNRYSTYRYAEPVGAAELSLKVSGLSDRDAVGNDYSPDEIAGVARVVLAEIVNAIYADASVAARVVFSGDRPSVPLYTLDEAVRHFDLLDNDAKVVAKIVTADGDTYNAEQIARLHRR